MEVEMDNGNGNRKPLKSPCNGLYEWVKPHILGVMLIIAVIGFTMGATLGPRRTSMAIIAAIILYMITTSMLPRTRIIFLLIAATLHIGALTSYYSNPIILPLIIIEQAHNKYSLNIDIVQLAILYEARLQIQALKACKTRQPENTKTPEEEITTMEPKQEPR
ncbi:MAG: hypothetical protein F7C81_05660 [Desulfurococcales archaeon]|nr:hypothetical protein [Desulfurococcales archaeon]